MQKSLAYFFIVFLLQPLLCMETIEECVNTLKPFLDNKELSIDKTLIKRIKENSTFLNISIMVQCITHLIETNNNNPDTLDYLIPILFNEKTINERIQRRTPLDLLALDTNAFNSALYKIKGNKNIANSHYNLIFKITDILNEKFIKLITPLDKEDTYTDFIRINGTNFVTHYNINESNYKNFFSIKDNDSAKLDQTQPNKINYWKASFHPTFIAEIISNDDICLYRAKIVSLLCCLKELKKKKNIVTVKQVINNLIIPYIYPDIFINQSTIVYNDIQRFIEKIKIASTYALNKFGKDQYLFFIHGFEPWFKEEMQKLVSFKNAKKIFKYYNKKEK